MPAIDLPLSKYLHDKHITNSKTARSVLAEMNETQLIELSGDCSSIIQSISSANPTNRLFNFSASNSICGAGSSCFGLACRLREATDLGKFASLYGDCVTIPDFLAAHRNEYRAKREFPEALAAYRETLLGDVLVLALYEPLFVEGLLRFNPNKIAHCSRCLARQVTSGQKKVMIKQSPELIKLATNILSEKVTYTFDGKNRISFTDPLGYTDLEGHSVAFGNPEALQGIASGELSTDSIKQIQIASGEAAKIVDDILQQNVGQMLKGATFLTPRRIDSLLLDSFNSATKLEYAGQSTLPSNLAHTIPIINDVPFEALVSVRREDEPYFERYKNSLTTVLRQLGPNPESQMVRQALDEEVRPHLLKIDQKLKTSQIKQKRKAQQNIAITGVTVTLGLAFASNYHLDAGASAGLLGTLAGTPAYKAVESILNRNAIPDEVAEDQYYFLWQKSKLKS